MTKYVLFDLDGTLTESGPGIMNGVRYALRSFAMEETDEEKLRLFIGPPLSDSFRQHYGMSEEEALRAVEAYRSYYHEKGVYENAPYPGVLEMLADLKIKGCHLAIASSKPQTMVDVVLDHFDLRAFFEVIVCGTDSGALHTKAGVIEEALRQFAVRDDIEDEEIRACAVMVGDRKYDILGGRENGIRTIGVRWGYAPEGELEEAGADEIAKEAEEVWKCLHGL